MKQRKRKVLIAAIIALAVGIYSLGFRIVEWFFGFLAMFGRKPKQFLATSTEYLGTTKPLVEYQGRVGVIIDRWGMNGRQWAEFVPYRDGKLWFNAKINVIAGHLTSTPDTVNLVFAPA